MNYNYKICLTMCALKPTKRHYERCKNSHQPVHSNSYFKFFVLTNLYQNQALQSTSKSLISLFIHRLIRVSAVDVCHNVGFDVFGLYHSV